MTSGGIDIVIVNWNSGGLLRRALGALASQRPDAVQVIVVDNASTDGSANVDHLPGKLQIELISNAANEGFARACNQGAAAGNAPVILFLNPDMVVHRAAIRAACTHLADGEAARIGVVGIKLLCAEGSVQRTTSRFPTAWSILGQSAGLDRLMPSIFPPAFQIEWDHMDTRDVDQVMGAFLMVRRDLFERLGGFDERFFVYYDDVDLCLRVHQAGWRCVHFAEVSAIHEGQGTTAQVSDARLFYLLRSRLLYAAKHFGLAETSVVYFATLLIEPLARAAHALLGARPVANLAALLRSYGWLLRALPRLRSSAREAITRRLPGDARGH